MHNDKAHVRIPDLSVFLKVQCSKFILHSLTVYLFILVFSHIFILQKNDQNSYHIEIECAQIVVLNKIGLSQCPIFKQLSISKSSIQRAITKFKNEEIYGNRKKSDRPRKTR